MHNEQGEVQNNLNSFESRTSLRLTRRVFLPVIGAGVIKLMHPQTTQAFYTDLGVSGTHHSLSESVNDKQPTELSVDNPWNIDGLMGIPVKKVKVENISRKIDPARTEQSRQIAQRVGEILPIGSVMPIYYLADDDQFAPATGAGPYIGCRSINGEFVSNPNGVNKIYLKASEPSEIIAWMIHETLHGSDGQLSGFYNQLNGPTAQEVKYYRDIATRAHKLFVTKNFGMGIRTEGSEFLEGAYSMAGDLAWPHFASRLHIPSLTITVEELTEVLGGINNFNVPSYFKSTLEVALEDLRRRGDSYFDGDELGKALGILTYTNHGFLDQFPQELAPQLDTILANGLEHADFEDFAEQGKNMILDPIERASYPDLWKSVFTNLQLIINKPIDQITSQLQQLSKATNQIGQY